MLGLAKHHRPDDAGGAQQRVNPLSGSLGAPSRDRLLKPVGVPKRQKSTSQSGAKNPWVLLEQVLPSTLGTVRRRDSTGWRRRGSRRPPATAASCNHIDVVAGRSRRWPASPIRLDQRAEPPTTRPLAWTAPVAAGPRNPSEGGRRPGSEQTECQRLRGGTQLRLAWIRVSLVHVRNQRVARDWSPSPPLEPKALHFTPAIHQLGTTRSLVGYPLMEGGSRCCNTSQPGGGRPKPSLRASHRQLDDPQSSHD